MYYKNKEIVLNEEELKIEEIVSNLNFIVLPFQKTEDIYYGLSTTFPRLVEIQVNEILIEAISEIYSNVIDSFIFVPVCSKNIKSRKCIAIYEDNIVKVISDDIVIVPYSVFYDYIIVLRDVMWKLAKPLPVKTILSILGGKISFIVADIDKAYVNVEKKAKAFLLFVDSICNNCHMYAIFLTPRLVRYIRENYLHEPEIKIIGHT